MSDQNLESNMLEDLVTQNRFFLVYLEHFTKVNLLPLKRKKAEVCKQLLDIFCDSDPPNILHSDNGRILIISLYQPWIQNCQHLKLFHGKHRHPESQGVVERANREIKDVLFGLMHDINDYCW